MLYNTNYSSRFCEQNSISEFCSNLNNLQFVTAHIGNNKLLCNTAKPFPIKTIV